MGADSHAERNLITSKAGAGLERHHDLQHGQPGLRHRRGLPHGARYGGRGLRHRPVGPQCPGSEPHRFSGKAARSREEIELIFDRNKGAIYSLYSRALRDQPELQGKMVLEFTISPTGEVTMCRVVSSELNDPDLEKKIVARVRLFRFEAKDVETITTTKPIDFFPA